MGQILNLLLHENIDDLKAKKAQLEKELGLINETIEALEK